MTALALHVHPSIVLAARVFGVLLFAAAVAGKLRHWTAFVGIVDRYRLLPATLAPSAAVAVVALEALACAGLALGLLPVAGLLGIVLLLLFAGAMAVNVARGETEMDCGCFQSALRQRLSGALVARNLVLALALLPLLTPAPPPGGTAELFDGLACGLALAVLNTAFGTLLALREPAAALQQRFA